jgi:CRISPR-associated protein Cas5d
MGERAAPVESGPLRLRVTGSLACFTRPELKTERVSYEVITPSAARALFECVLWKPEIKWEVREIAVINPVQWASFRRNEVNSKMSPRSGEIIADEDRAQRNTVALRDVDYVLTAGFRLTKPVSDECNVAKYTNMFRDRLQRGQRHRAPYLGCREFEAQIDEAPERVETYEGKLGLQRSLGELFYDWDWTEESDRDLSRGPSRALFFQARLVKGVLRVPPRSEVLAMNPWVGDGAREGGA